MAILLENHPCYRSAGSMKYDGSGGSFTPQTPPIPILNNCAILPKDTGVTHEPVEILLDTGTEITLIKQEKLQQLEDRLQYPLPIQGRIYFDGVPQPSYSLQLAFPTGRPFSTDYGFVALAETDKVFDVGDVWLGQDILSQLIVTFNGASGTVTIEDRRL
ncbi:MAG: hypothetical protein AB7N91_16205 [Candidatus Tectimicrobiota bacterium]